MNRPEDDYFVCVNPFEDKPRAAKTAKAKAPAPTKLEIPEDMEESLFGGVFPKKPETNWFVKAGIKKRVHAKEIPLFTSEYGLCCATNKYKHFKDLVMTG